MINALVDALMQRCRANPSPNLIQVSEGQGQRLSAQELWKRALEKRYYMRSFGMRPGDMWLDESFGIEQMINLLACIQGSFHYTAQQVPFYQDRKLQSIRVFSQKNRNSALLCRTLDLPASLKFDEEFSLIVPTRGLHSGQSMPVRLDSHKILHQLETHTIAMNLRPHSRRLITLPGTHSFGLILERLLGLYAGQDLIFLMPPRLHPRSLLQTIEEEDIDFIACVPEVLKLLLAFEDRHPEALTVLAPVSIHSGTAPWSLVERERLSQRVQHFFWSYGLTECGPGVLLNGKPIGCLIRLQAAQDLPASHTQFEELWVATPSLGSFPGRLSRSVDGFYPTGDLALRLADKRIDVIGRSEDLFLRTSQQWIDRRDIEQQLQKDYQLAAAHISLNSQGDALSLYLVGHDGQSINLQTSTDELEKKLTELFHKPIDIRYQDMNHWTAAWAKR